MKKVTILLIFSLLSNVCFAYPCDWTTIKPLPDGGFEYGHDLHLCVGNLSQDWTVKDKQITDLNQAITDKNAALAASDQRATLWSNTSASLEDRLQKVDSIEKTNQWLFFGLGIVTALGAGFMASKLIKP